MTKKALSVADRSFPGGLKQYALDQTSLELENGTWPQVTVQNNDLTFSRGVMELLRPVPKRGQIFAHVLNNQGVRGATILQVFQSRSNSSQLYACGATLIVDTAWANLLADAAQTRSQTTILLMDNNEAMDLISSSSRHETYAQVLNGSNSTETLSESIRAAVLVRYGDYDALAGRAGDTFEVSINGQTYFLLAGTVKLTAYEENELVLVIAIPRSTIFSEIDSAQTHSMVIAVCLSTGLAVVMALVFALILAPLRHMAKAMGLLTQLNFGALENGKILDESSYISEIRAVQSSFSTMVLAFAGGIRKNRELAQMKGKGIRDSMKEKERFDRSL
ncbi:hypothetical protein HDU87_003150 [Geranomyces variabilis]|uniref:Uncharacterized protein n=1 Tax=Geranomyces variabilis TaxID=109894 RepID=A0AAD5XQW6_9FUNG|nr:hypothetical protein HDU87_003150 [Geranomyces variabilis]